MKPTRLAFLLLAAITVHSRTVDVTTTTEYQNAIADATAGDTILIHEGVYSDVQAPQDADGSLDHPIVVKGAPGDSVVFDSYSEGLKHYPAHWVFEGIHFKGNDSYHLFHIKPGAKGYLTIRNCHFSGCIDKAIKIDFAAYEAPTDVWPDYVLLENCTMEIGQAGLMNNDGADYLTCRNNHTYGFVDGGVGYVYFSKGGMAYSVFENNLIEGGRYGPLSVGGGSMDGPFDNFKHDADLAAAYPAKTIEAVNCVIRNNIVLNAENGSHSSTTLDCEIYNNTFVDCDYALQIHNHHGDPTGLKFYNNLMVRTGGISRGGDFVIESDNVSLDVDPGAVFTDYHAVDIPGSDLRIAPSAESQVGTGRLPYSHPDWTFHTVSVANLFDFYGSSRANPPVVGATTFESLSATPGLSPRRTTVAYASMAIADAAGVATLRLQLAGPVPIADILIQDMRGAHVKTLFYGPLPGGTTEWALGGMDHRGRCIAAGTYVVRVSFGRDVLSERFTIH